MKIELLLGTNDRNGEPLGNIAPFVGRMLSSVIREGFTMVPAIVFYKGAEEGSLYIFAFLADDFSLTPIRDILKSFLKVTNQESAILATDGKHEVITQ